MIRNLIVALAIASASPVFADLVVGWDFDPLAGGANNFGVSPYAAASLDPNVTSSGLIRGAGVTQGATGASGAANAWGGTGFITTSPSESAAIAASEFMSFSVTVDSGYTLSLSDIGAYNVRRSATGPSTGQWQYSVAGGGWSDIGTDTTWGGTTTAAGNAKPVISLAGFSDLQNVPGGTTIDFRVVLWGATNAGGTWYLNDPTNSVGNDFTLNGVTALAAIPEPTAALFGSLLAGAFGLMVARRPAGRE